MEHDCNVILLSNSKFVKSAYVLSTVLVMFYRVHSVYVHFTILMFRPFSVCSSCWICSSYVLFMLLWFRGFQFVLIRSRNNIFAIIACFPSQVFVHLSKPVSQWYLRHGSREVSTFHTSVTRLYS